ncbi:CocE/NonD family hydrolase [Singulisphaera sp. PoT]|uniref:CocE/NonD family hydrolase n=1 Tax=Singulisphaera sp. PoT TaxID=3411797 RepID=UPI003BF47FEA
MPQMKLPPSYVLLLIGTIGQPSPDARAQAPAGSSRPASFDVVVEKNVPVVVRDGTRLAADLYRPARGDKAVAERFPALLTRTPYNKDGVADDARYYASRGYVVVANDVRGRYASEGRWRLIADDPADGYDVVEWIAARPWSDGKVGTFGTSYPGGTQHAMAEMKPPHLTTMIPIDALSNCGISGMRQGGAFELRFMNWIFNIGAPNGREALADPALRASLVASGKRIREYVDDLPIRPGTTPLRVVPDYEWWLVEALRSGPETPFWKIKGMSVVDHVSDYADIPVAHVTGWYDSWTRQVTLNYEALSQSKRSPQHLMIGPWVHNSQGSNVSGEVEFTADAGIDLRAWRLRWYDHWLRGEANGVESSPRIYLYIMGTGDDRRSAAGRLKHGGYWRSEREWPLTRARATPYYLQADGSLSPAAPVAESSATTYTYDPDHPVPTIGGNISSGTELMLSGGYDQRPREDTHPKSNLLPLSTRRDVVVFRSAPLTDDLEVTGPISVKLWVSSTATDTDFTAKLIDEIPPNPDYPLGFDLNLTDSILRTRYRNSLDHPELLQPSSVVPITITLYPTSNVFKKGHRIRLDVSSSNFPRFDTNPNTGSSLGDSRRRIKADNTLYHDGDHPSHILLPLIPAATRP